jgi:MoxR-like ATPase
MNCSTSMPESTSSSRRNKRAPVSMYIPWPDRRVDTLRVDLPAIGKAPASVHLFDEGSVLAVNAALSAGRPLLVRGDPGVGKSQLARAAAAAMKRAFISFVVDEQTEPRDLRWSFDSVARLARAQVAGAALKKPADSGQKSADPLAGLEEVNFLQPGPLWWTFDWGSAEEQAKRAHHSTPQVAKGSSPDNGVVLLIDEIDKADPSVPNGLLESLGNRRFSVRGRSEDIECDGGPAPLVVVTTNEERVLPDAFLRRCFVLPLDLPTERDNLVERLLALGAAHFGACDGTVLRRAADLLATDRADLKKRGLYAPGAAEYLDLLRAVTTQESSAAKQRKLLERVAKYALRKHPEERKDTRA